MKPALFETFCPQCIFVRQPNQMGLGDAVLCAERAVSNEPFAVLLADDFITQSGTGVTSDLITRYEQTGRSQISVMAVEKNEISKYGVVIPSDRPGVVSGLVEKPAVEDAPSSIVSIGRYVMTPDIFDILRQQTLGSGGEIQLADAINVQAASDAVEMIELSGCPF